MLRRKLFSSMVKTLFVIFISIFFSLNCTPKKIASDITAQIMRSGAPAFEMESDVEIAQDAGLTMIKMIEAFQYDNPSNKNLNTLLSRSYANYAQGFLEYQLLINRGINEEEYQKYLQRTKTFYDRGKQYGLRVLKTNGSFKAALSKDLDTFAKSLKGFGRGAVPQLFWTAMNWGSLTNLSKDSPLAIAEFPKVEAIMQRVLDLDEHYFYSSPHLFFGYSYGSRPKMFGGDAEKSKAHFETAITAYQRKFLMGLVYYAEVYAVQTQNVGLFESLLSEVLEADAGALPEARLANELAQRKAKWLLMNKEKFFDI